jgi:hypothetical protein
VNRWCRPNEESNRGRCERAREQSTKDNRTTTLGRSEPPRCRRRLCIDEPHDLCGELRVAPRRELRHVKAASEIATGAFVVESAVTRQTRRDVRVGFAGGSDEGDPSA